MKQSIVEKLRATLTDGINSESKVVYLLAESRKLLDEWEQTVPFAVRLYINWALHVDLDHDNTTAQFLKRVDSYVASFLAGNSDIVLEHSMHREFILFDTFRNEFRAFLIHYGLPTDVCDKDWREFVKHYIGVIEDGSLACKGTGLRLIDKVVFRKGERVEPGAIMPFNLLWDIFKGKNKIMTLEVNAVNLANGELMHSFSVRLEPGIPKAVVIPF